MAESLQIIAEIGINHNADINIAKSLIALASNFGATHVKFQKKTPELCVPKNQWDNKVKTPFGYPMKYIDYKKKMEFGIQEFDIIDNYCKKLGIEWFSSIWDKKSLHFMMRYDPPYIKIPSACITDLHLLQLVKFTGRDVIMSTGMSTKDDIDTAVEILGDNLKCLMHTTSSYPTPNEQMNMMKINTLQGLYGEKYDIGFSNHCADLIYIVQAYLMGCDMLEFHVTLDRTMPGTDQWASIGPLGFNKIMKHLNNIKIGMGDGTLSIQDSEIPIIKKLRKKDDN